MMFRKVVLLIVLPLIVACSEQGRRNEQLPSATGKPGEVVAVVSSGAIGEKLRSFLLQPQAGLPQDEPMFDLILVPPSAFKSVFERHRTVLTINVGSEYRRSHFTVSRNRWSDPQLHVNLNAPSESAMLYLIDSVKARLVQIILAEDCARIQAKYAQYRNSVVSRRLRARLGIDLIVPQGYSVDVNDSSFIWISYESSDMSQAIIIYTQQLDDPSQLEMHNIIAYRDSLFRQRVPGPLKGTYMQAELRMYEPDSLLHVFCNRYNAVELRGLWRVENDFMGGPFISYAISDTLNRRIINLYGYVYAPQHEKRNYVRQIDAILRSCTFVEPQVMKNSN